VAKTLRDELKKRHRFESVEQEATLAILRTGDLLENLPCLEVANRMIQVAPAITRVVDQLLALKLITKTQSDRDRRVYDLGLTPAAEQLLKNLDQPVLDLHASLLSSVSKADLKELIRILELVRAGIVEP
jgi:DNA-binding MarR family transcriptional regulator